MKIRVTITEQNEWDFDTEADSIEEAIEWAEGYHEDPSEPTRKRHVATEAFVMDLGA